ncbi:MAG TPA: hypothetical protein DDZ51_30005 [Planctomycetaceae bacterium]|nr:hypothetical protein [Planctomycetaceae bacterium]
MVANLILTGCQDVRVAGDLQRQLIELLSKENLSTVQCDEITTMDASTIQLLLAAKKESGNQFNVKALPTSDCVRWFELAGVSSRLMPATA